MAQPSTSVRLVITALVVGIVAGVAWFVLRTPAPSERKAPEEEVPPPPPDPPQIPLGSGPALERIRARGHLLVGTDTGTPAWTGTPPMYFPTGPGLVDGFDYRLGGAIARSLGVAEAKWVHAVYDDLESSLADKQFDVFISGYVDDGAEGVLFSESYHDFGLCLVVAASSTVRTTDDLRGKRVGIFNDDAAEVWVSKNVHGYTRLQKFDDNYWDALDAGTIDAFIYDYPYTPAEIAKYYEQHPDRAGLLRIAQFNLNDAHYSVGVRASEPELLAGVNAAIAAWRGSPAYAEAVKQFLKANQEVAAPSPDSRTYVVRAGDTLSGIARAELGDVERWRELWALNKTRFPDPNLIEVGDPVVLP